MHGMVAHDVEGGPAGEPVVDRGALADVEHRVGVAHEVEVDVGAVLDKEPPERSEPRCGQVRRGPQLPLPDGASRARVRGRCRRRKSAPSSQDRDMVRRPRSGSRPRSSAGRPVSRRRFGALTLQRVSGLRRGWTPYHLCSAYRPDRAFSPSMKKLSKIRILIDGISLTLEIKKGSRLRLPLNVGWRNRLSSCSTS